MTNKRHKPEGAFHCNPAIAISTVLSLPLDHIYQKTGLVNTSHRHFAPYGSVLPYQATRARQSALTTARTRSMHARRRAGLGSFPFLPRPRSAYPVSDQIRPCETFRSLSEDVSVPSSNLSPFRRDFSTRDNSFFQSYLSARLHSDAAFLAPIEARPALTP